MSHLRRLNYAVSLAIIVTALLIFMADYGEVDDLGLLLFPGVTVEFILTTLIPHGDGEAYGYTWRGWAANVALYSLGFYFLLLLYPLLKWFYAEIRGRGW